ncbi:Uroporphyrin-III C-methyltransferase [Rhodotorula toruloides ATCC 204091]|uniref:Uroporphyrin-III C-methyltransferase n=1 Tax=Rhodotorula toruloides TaxID=5286 RepID=A0A0K3CUD8_RHOTO|nr:Uroporphyrin-III C-methyltransferase [Rhodotorula toruloides ATCC 204091]KAK4330555.1 Uroporphyrinogen-III C-methyltransferase [Rhodotorula toruloides]PRQ70893.1 uroporphyrin-III C-methyltransferase [Rhodotorula toruloides]
MPSFPSPEPGASLLLAFTPATPQPSSPRPQSLLLLGPTRLSALRAFAALESGYRVVVGAPAPKTDERWDAELRFRLEQNEIERIDWPIAEEADAREDAWRDWFDGAERTGALDGVRMIVLSDTIVSHSSSSARRRTLASARAFRAEAERRRFFVNVADCPDLSDFGWAVSHRFDLVPPSAPSSDPTSRRKSPLQLALTTNTSACRLATRLRREIVASLPKSAGAAVEAVGRLREELKAQVKAAEEDAQDGEDDSEETQGVGLNRPVEQLTRAKSQALDEQCRLSNGESSWTGASAQLTRMRYVSQLSEYWPLDRLATVSLASLSAPSTPLAPLSPSLKPAYHDLDPASESTDLALSPSSSPKKGRIFLLGTGPGNPLLLTRVAHLLLTTSDPSSPFFVDLFLSDKLVPPQILALIPPKRREGVVIARKYPGNAEAAQEELMALAIEAAETGKTVLRLKQGDPFLYGRGGEEVLRFRAVAGIESVVLPGLSSSLAGPTLAGIPVTQRGVAESVVVCTGVGRGGRDVAPAPYERGKTLCVLMGVARLSSLVKALMDHPTSPYPPHLPIALVERASSPDQRVVASTIDRLAAVLETLPPHRPPGMIVVGWAVLCLEGEGDMGILDDPEDEGRDERDRQRVQKWLGDIGYKVREGLSEGWMSLVGGLEAEGEQVSAE